MAMAMPSLMHVNQSLTGCDWYTISVHVCVKSLGHQILFILYKSQSKARLYWFAIIYKYATKNTHQSLVICIVNFSVDGIGTWSFYSNINGVDELNNRFMLKENCEWDVCFGCSRTLFKVHMRGKLIGHRLNFYTRSHTEHKRAAREMDVIKCNDQRLCLQNVLISNKID